MPGAGALFLYAIFGYDFSRNRLQENAAGIKLVVNKFCIRKINLVKC